MTSRAFSTSLDRIPWDKANDDGTKSVTLVGTRESGVTFTYAFFIPAGVWDGPHSHIAAAHLVVARGELCLGFGTALDRDAATRFPQGSFLYVPGGEVHFDGADQDTILVARFSIVRNMAGSPRQAPGTRSQDRPPFTTARMGTRERSAQEVAAGLRAMGGPTIGSTYIWQLRTGKRDNPTKRHLEALAAYFEADEHSQLPDVGRLVHFGPVSVDQPMLDDGRRKIAEQSGDSPDGATLRHPGPQRPATSVRRRAGGTAGPSDGRPAGARRTPNPVGGRPVVPLPCPCVTG